MPLRHRLGSRSGADISRSRPVMGVVAEPAGGGLTHSAARPTYRERVTAPALRPRINHSTLPGRPGDA